MGILGYHRIALDVTKNSTKSSNWTDSFGSNVTFIGEAKDDGDEKVSFVGLNGTSWGVYKANSKVDVFCIKNISKFCFENLTGKKLTIFKNVFQQKMQVKIHATKLRHLIKHTKS